MASLRSRLYLYLVVAVAPLLILIGLGLGFAITIWVERDFDGALEAKARALVALTRQDSTEIEFEYASESMPEFETAIAPEYFELWFDANTLFQRSKSFELARGAETTRLARGPPAIAAPVFGDTILPDGRHGRQVQIDFRPQYEESLESNPAQPEMRQLKAPPNSVSGPAGSGSPVLTLIVARERGSLDRQIRLLYSSLALAALVLFVVFAAVVPVLLRSALRPLDSLIRQARAFDGTSPGNRFEVPGAPDEIEPVVSQLNSLLDRLEKAFLRERRLSGDIAHELKTPVAELRNLCEVGQRWPEDTEEVREFFSDARSISLHMERLVNHLLLLARYEEGSQPVKAESVCVAEIIDASWCPLAEFAGSRGLEFRNEVSAKLRLETDPDLFALIAANLLSNAATHADEDSWVTCTGERNNDGVSVCFANPAGNLEPNDIAVMFDRFWRKDDARTGGRNIGLGLSLVQVFATLLGFEIRTELGADAVLRIRLLIPPSAAR